MDIILKKASIFSSVIGLQQYNEQGKYRLMNFCIETKANDRFLLYNCLTKELISLSFDEYNYLKTEPLDTSNSIIIKLISDWFLVPAEFDDCKFSDQICNLVRSINIGKEITSYDILTTTDCNARCFYCFECGVQKKYMTKETAYEVAEYIKKKSNGKKFHIQWFGGEPLYNIEVIDVISELLVKWNLDFNSSMTTNGYLFNDSIIKRAKETWKLSNVQITLDGQRELYNKIKNFIYKDDSYSRVTENIGKLLDNNIKVVVRLNVDKHNYAELFNLVEELSEKYKNKSGCMIRPAMLFENTGKYKHSRTNEEREFLAEKVKMLKLRIKELGYSINSVELNNKFKINRCMADSINAVMILPDGNIGKCEHHLEDKLIGHISDDPEITYWSNYLPHTELCKKCKVYPICFKLNDCQSNNQECYDFEREDLIDAIKEKMIYTYSKRLSNN